ncbi:hypothetical protein [Saccharothrix sp. NRRL B-16314]|uniref:hypothetical protein n=1 Tax=Saccharothrix sp. NRRL B-16314 TaxID=1463825 RepID=UPI000689BCC5|nr:hypothetical protein [Saccharothrix sp. NRRL B-16314]
MPSPRRDPDGTPPSRRDPDGTPSSRRDPDGPPSPRRDPDSGPQHRRDPDTPHRDQDGGPNDRPNDRTGNNSDQPNSDRPDGTHPDGSRSDGTHPDSNRPDGDRTESDPADGDRTDGTGADGPDIDDAHARHGETTPAGISHHRGDPDMGDLPHRVPADPRYFTADVHITPDGRARIGNHTYTPEQYGDLLRRNGWDGKTPIRLIGCDAGTNNFANRLSTHTGADVLAPTKPAWTDSNGRVYTSDAEIGPDGNRQPKIPPNGEWNTHRPDGTSGKASDDGFAPGTDKSDKQDLDPTDARDRGDDGTDPADRTDDEHPHKPPSASDPREPSEFPDPVDPGPAPDTREPDFEQDRSRGSIVEQVDVNDPKRVTTKDGLIETIDGKPVKEYVEDLSKARAAHNGGPANRDNGPFGAVAIDRRTGLITEGVNGQDFDVIAPANLHPLLRENFRDMDEWQHPVMKNETDRQQIPVLGEDGKALKDADNQVIREDWVLQGQVHQDVPLRHAEVKAANELLWARQRDHEIEWRRQHGPDSDPPPLSRQALEDMRFDPRHLQDQYRKIDGQRTQVGHIGDPGPACGNCNVILRDVGSYTGRLQFAPFDYRSRGSLIPPVTE